MIEFRLPSLGSDMDQGTLVEWKVRPGDAVARGQVVAIVDTAKAAIDVECWQPGTVHALLAEPGSTLPVGTVMAVLRAEGETAEAVAQAMTRQAAATPTTTLAATPATTPAATDALTSGLASSAPMATRSPAGASPAAFDAERPRLSPLARRRARELGIDASRLAGTGPQAAVTLADVDAAARAQPTPAAAAQPSPTTRAQDMRRVIAAAMSRSKREIPHYYLSEDIAFEAATAWLAERNRDLPPAQRLLPAALMLKAVALGLRRYPEFNGYWRDGAFVPGDGVHLGVAVSLREGGLVAPALRDVPARDLAGLTRGLLDLVRRTRAGSLRSSELAGSTITVTNLGDQGVDSVFGVIYPPQVALVGFGRVRLRPWATPEGGVRALPVVTATLAADHRASDGHRGTRLLAEIRECLQDPPALDRCEDLR